MSFTTAGYQLAPVLPELVLAVGAMALLMLGAYRGQETTKAITTLAVLLLVVVGVLEYMLPAGKQVTFGVILSACYALWLYRKVVFGALVKPSLASMKDLTFRECVTLFPLIALTILFGVYPKPVLDMSAASVQQLVNNYNTAVTAVKAAALIQ